MQFFFFFFFLMDLKVKNHSGRGPHTVVSKSCQEQTRENAKGSERYEIFSAWIDGRQREEEKIDERFEYGQENPSAARARPRKLSFQLFQHGVIPYAHLPHHVSADTSPCIASTAASTFHVAVTSSRHTCLTDDPGFHAPRYKKHCLLLLDREPKTKREKRSYSANGSWLHNGPAQSQVPKDLP
ncbi:unnamed protein product [Musa hybrid cultivar]